MPKPTKYDRILQEIFFSHHKTGGKRVEFDREEIVAVAQKIGVAIPKNLGDVIYSFRFRKLLPKQICDTAPAGKEWIIRLAGAARYAFCLCESISIIPNRALAEIKVPDATPGVVAMYALDDEQALLARLRYNRLLDIFMGVACYSLQNHLRTNVHGLGQTETDEIYIGIGRSGAHYVFPVQAKGGRDALGIVQVEQDHAMCKAKFPSLICRPVAAQFLKSDLICLFAFTETPGGFRISREKHYRLVPLHELSEEELQAYQEEEGLCGANR